MIPIILDSKVYEPVNIAIYLVYIVIFFVMINLFSNESDDDDDHSGGMMVPSYEGSD